MSITVCKFGGSSLANAVRVRAATQLVRTDTARHFVVVSAPGKRGADDVKITDCLLRAYDAVSIGVSARAAMQPVRERMTELSATLGGKADIASEIDAFTDKMAAGRASRAECASRGEYWCARIVAEQLGWQMIDAAELIVFSASGEPDFPASEEKIRRRLPADSYAVIPGFYGADALGNIRLFSRGGSDVTGALVAAALGASVYENFTDVAGVFCADPRLYPAATPIPRIRYADLRALSLMGANVLHEDAVLPVRRAGIPIHLAETARPELPGTWILPDDADVGDALFAVSGKGGYTAFRLERAGASSDPSFLPSLLRAVKRFGMPAADFVPGADACALFLPLSEKTPRAAVTAALCRACNPDALRVTEKVALLRVLGGEQMPLCVLRRNGIEVFTAHGSQKCRAFTLSVRERDLSAAVCALCEGKTDR